MPSVRTLLLAPFFAAYGLLVIARGILRIGLMVATFPRHFQTEIRCTTCGVSNDVHDRWICGECGAEYLGAVHTCGMCQASASWFPCARCRSAIQANIR